MVPLLAIILLSPVSSNHGPTVWGIPWGPPTFWDSFVKWKGEGLASPIFYSHHFSEKPLLLAMLAIFVWALATRTMVVNSRMVIPLAAFGVIFMVMPFELLGAAFADYRLPSGVAFFALASIGWGETSRVRIDVVRLLLTVCLIVRVDSVVSTWQPAQAIIEEYDAALRLVPPGSRLLVILGYNGLRYPPLEHVPVLSAAKQGVFVPYIFTDDGVLVDGIQLLKLMPGYRDYRSEYPIIPSDDHAIISDLKKFDYVLEIRKPQFEVPTGISLDEVGRGQTYVLHRFDQDAAGKW